MPFFDISEIEKHMLPPSRELLFSAVGKNAPFPEVASRLKELAARWEGFVHPDFGDSYGDYDLSGNRCNFENLYIDRRRELADLTLKTHVNDVLCTDDVNSSHCEIGGIGK